MGFGIITGTALATLAGAAPPVAAHEAELESPTGRVWVNTSHSIASARDPFCDGVGIRGDFKLSDGSTRVLTPDCNQTRSLSTSLTYVSMRKCERNAEGTFCSDWVGV